MRTETDTIPLNKSWTRFIAYAAKARLDSDARLVKQIGGRNITECKRIIRKELQAKRISMDSYGVRFGAIVRMGKRFQQAAHDHSLQDHRDWVPIGGGAWKRKTHISGK